jgi:hypothetical protein
MAYRDCFLFQVSKNTVAQTLMTTQKKGMTGEFTPPVRQAANHTITPIIAATPACSV